jgi:phenylacetate-CoA ligase
MSVIQGALWTMRLAAAGVFPLVGELRDLQRASAEEVGVAQRSKLTRLLVHAAAHVPFYRSTLAEAGVIDGGTVHLEAFERLPLLDKATIRSRFEDLRSTDANTRRPHTNTSGGSTGEPLKFLQDEATDRWKTATKLLFDEWTGYRRGEPFAILWGASRDLSDTSLTTRIGTYLRNELALNAYLMPESVMDRYLAELNAFRPRLILAYAQSIYQLALHAERTGHPITPPRAVMTSATNLEPEMRTTIERVFGAPVFDRYGSREVGDIACENGDGGGLVVCPVTHYLEVVDQDGRVVPDGTPGELVVTLLTNYSMPLIRYRIGDAGTLGPASGSVAWPRLTQVLGRVTDIFYTAAGDQVYGGYFTRLFYGKYWVAQFQVVQESHTHVVVRVVPQGTVEAATIDSERLRVTRAIQDAMGQDCRVEFLIVDAIEVGPTGKRRYTISKVGPPR